MISNSSYINPRKRRAFSSYMSVLFRFWCLFSYLQRCFRSIVKHLGFFNWLISLFPDIEQLWRKWSFGFRGDSSQVQFGRSKMVFGHRTRVVCTVTTKNSCQARLWCRLDCLICSCDSKQVFLLDDCDLVFDILVNSLSFLSLICTLNVGFRPCNFSKDVYCFISVLFLSFLNQSAGLILNRLFAVFHIFLLRFC